MKLTLLLNLLSPAAALLAVKVGVLMPAVIGFISQPTWPRWIKALLAAVFCIVAAIAVCVTNHVYDGANLGVALFVVLGIAWNLYDHCLEPLGLGPWWERTTSQITGFILTFPANAGAFASTLSSAWQITQTLTPPVNAANTESGSQQAAGIPPAGQQPPPVPGSTSLPPVINVPAAAPAPDATAAPVVPAAPAAPSPSEQAILARAEEIRARYASGAPTAAPADPSATTS